MADLPQPILDVLEFEKSLRVEASVLDDPFYQCPSDAATVKAAPGTLLKVEKDVDTKSYLLPAGTTVSKFMYQSEKLNGTPVPVSALILWPYATRTQPDGYSVVAWAHGTSGANVNQAPSNYKNLWQHFLAPYQIALQGYVVIATDYAGLGVQTDASGAPIMHEYLASPSQANDVVHSVTAARTAFPELSKQFVVIGHSQGGGAAWAVAQKAADHPTPGYLGAIAISPYTNFLIEESIFGPKVGAAICRVIASSFPEFDPREILTPEGAKRVDLMFNTGAGVAAAIALFHDVDVVKPDWRQNPFVIKHADLTCSGGKAIGGPLLVIHGQADPMNSLAAVEIAVEKTARLFPSAQLQSVWLPDVKHSPALGASQQLWMDWIADRFAGIEVPAGHQTSLLKSSRPSKMYHKDQNWYLEKATKFFQAV
ncbi:MAG: hypothetical protein Q9190_001317 [Brigantiaea leucoxantha]